MADKTVADSTDWLSTPLSGLSSVEAAFRCQVCKDFYNTPMITTCSHTFCSLCIRRALSSDGKCPMCRAPEQEMKLRSNWAMEEAVEAFTKSRQSILEFAKNTGTRISASPKRKTRVDSNFAANEPEPKRLRASARLSSKNRSYSEIETIPDSDGDLPEEADDEVEPQADTMMLSDEKDDDYRPEPADGLVPCPVCQDRMKDWQVFKHLEICPGPGQKQQTHVNKAGPSTVDNFTQAQRTQSKAMERLPALNYSLLKDQNLRKKMWELGISSNGSRQLLEKRHKEWITLWNANCDSLRPKKRSELLHDLDTWERTQGGRVALGKISSSTPAVKDKDFDGAAWATMHDDSFKDLIASARRSRAEAAKKRDDDKETVSSDPSGSTAASAPNHDAAGGPSVEAEDKGTAESSASNEATREEVLPDISALPEEIDDIQGPTGEQWRIAHTGTEQDVAVRTADIPYIQKSIS